MWSMNIKKDLPEAGTIHCRAQRLCSMDIMRDLSVADAISGRE